MQPDDMTRTEDRWRLAELSVESIESIKLFRSAQIREIPTFSFNESSSCQSEQKKLTDCTLEEYPLLFYSRKVLLSSTIGFFELSWERRVSEKKEDPSWMVPASLDHYVEIR